jgi:hypothetical protein
MKDKYSLSSSKIKLASFFSNDSTSLKLRKFLFFYHHVPSSLSGSLNMEKIYVRDVRYKMSTKADTAQSVELDLSILEYANNSIKRFWLFCRIVFYSRFSFITFILDEYLLFQKQEPVCTRVYARTSFKTSC